jgi:hypothetical protein
MDWQCLTLLTRYAVKRIWEWMEKRPRCFSGLVAQGKIWPDLPNQRIRLTTIWSTAGDTVWCYPPIGERPGLVSVERGTMLSPVHQSKRQAPTLPLRLRCAECVFPVTLLEPMDGGQPFPSGYLILPVAPAKLPVELTSDPEIGPVVR